MSLIKHPRSYFEQKYATELTQHRSETSTRELECLQVLLDEGMDEPEFLAQVVSIDESKSFESKQEELKESKVLVSNTIKSIK